MLVPAGLKSSLTRIAVQDEEADEDAEETQQSTIDNYTGVSIKVCMSDLHVLASRLNTTSGFLQLPSR